jgi:RecJ-like exonuclease
MLTQSCEFCQETGYVARLTDCPHCHGKGWNYLFDARWNSQPYPDEGHVESEIVTVIIANGGSAHVQAV